MKQIQLFARMFFVAFTVSMLLLIHNPKAIWGLPFGLIVGLLTQAEKLTKKSLFFKNKKWEEF